MNCLRWLATFIKTRPTSENVQLVHEVREEETNTDKNSEQKACFENLCFKVILFYAGNLIYVTNLGTIICAKSTSHTLSQLTISHVDRTPALPKG